MPSGQFSQRLLTKPFPGEHVWHVAKSVHVKQSVGQSFNIRDGSYVFSLVQTPVLKNVPAVHEVHKLFVRLNPDSQD